MSESYRDATKGDNPKRPTPCSLCEHTDAELEGELQALAVLLIEMNRQKHANRRKHDQLSKVDF
jgi:hypothetical protein